MTNPLAEAVNRPLEEETPALFDALSPLGRRAAFPPDIPFQAAEARGKAFNATIGQITDGHGQALTVPALASLLESLSPTDRNRACLYSPVEGIREVREAWRSWQRHDDPGVDSSLPLVTVGLTHGLSLVADLFAGEGRAVAVPVPYWGNYRQTFATRTGAQLLEAPAYAGGRYNCRAIPEALEPLEPGEPAVALLNVPSNPGGYSPTREERSILRQALVEEAERRPLVVVCDDAYAGLVYEEEAPAGSIFWELAGAHPALVPVKVDGATKELGFFGGRVGFLTFAVPGESAAATALESKVKCLVRATLGSPVAASQMLLLQSLRREDLLDEVAALHRRLERRYRVLREALEKVDRAFLQPLPCNSGCFVLLELGEGLELEAESVRRHLLDHEDTGLISIGRRHLRIAFCSVAAAALPELVRRIERGVRDLAAAGPGSSRAR